MFLCVLLGGMAVALTIGLLDVLVWHADAINSQKDGERGRGPGALGGIPGGVYLSALHILVTSKSSTANQVAGVVLFVVSSSRW
jgi:hypothetical protein